MTEQELRAGIEEVCRRLWERGLVAGRDGNVSVALDEGHLLVTPAGISKRDVTAESLVVVSRDGSVTSGSRPPTSEIAVHLRAYGRRADVGAVVHAHPPHATAFAVAGETLPGDVLPEITVLLGPVPLVPYATPGSNEVADRFEPYWAAHDAFLMANHGALTLGPTLDLAYQRMESLDHAARIIATARWLGGVRRLAPDEVRVLEEARRVLSDSARLPTLGAKLPNNP